MDVVGIFAMAFITAFGESTVCDLLLDRRLFCWVQNHRIESGQRQRANLAPVITLRYERGLGHDNWHRFVTHDGVQWGTNGR
ncbi:MAG TPA: hypothetical protein PLS42_05415 [Candidatus Competibacter denitrificans]|uniref:TRIC cation channel family protein n=1 Tax=Candidatus Competibacter denitrificans TaxID=1400862 RepID=UPI001F5B5A30|nr:hypothetical protein [Candidatus Competibacter denitrificans]HRC69091.1 hypothetical protein [Candidatus Competibacter denitrificans]